MATLPIPQPTLTDHEIELAPFMAADAPTMVAWDRDPEMAKWFDWSLAPVPDELHLAHAIGVIRGWAQEYRDGHRAAFLVRDVRSGAPRGSAELTFPEHGGANISYSTIAEHRGRGIATRAVRLLAGWGLDLGVGEIRLTADAANLPSIAVARAAGFRKDRVVPRSLSYDGFEPWAGQRHDAELWLLRRASA